MGIFCRILTDILYVIEILTVCGLYLQLNIKKDKYKYIKVTKYFLPPVDAFADLWYNQTAEGKKRRSSRRNEKSTVVLLCFNLIFISKETAFISLLCLPTCRQRRFGRFYCHWNICAKVVNSKK